MTKFKSYLYLAHVRALGTTRRTHTSCEFFEKLNNCQTKLCIWGAQSFSFVKMTNMKRTFKVVLDVTAFVSTRDIVRSTVFLFHPQQYLVYLCDSIVLSHLEAFLERTFCEIRWRWRILATSLHLVTLINLLYNEAQYMPKPLDKTIFSDLIPLEILCTIHTRRQVTWRNLSISLKSAAILW